MIPLPYLKIGAIVAVLLAIGSTYLYISHLQSRVKALTEQVSACSSAIETQNAAVAALKSDSDARVARAKDEVTKAVTRAKTAEARASSFYSAKPTGELCEAALDLINR